jgi:hypothetical protein
VLPPVILLACCFFALLIIPALLFVLTSIFRLACVLCGLPRPSVAAAAGIMLIIRVSTTASEAVMKALVAEVGRTAGLPNWECNIIVLFLFLPLDLLISAGLHAGLMNIKFGKGIEVWFVQMLIYLGIGLLLTFVALLYFLART